MIITRLVFTKYKEHEVILVGHIPIEFSYLFDGNKIDVKVRGGKQLENGLVVPATYFVCGNNKKLAEIFLEGQSSYEH